MKNKNILSIFTTLSIIAGSLLAVGLFFTVTNESIHIIKDGHVDIALFGSGLFLVFFALVYWVMLLGAVEFKIEAFYKPLEFIISIFSYSGFLYAFSWSMYFSGIITYTAFVENYSFGALAFCAGLSIFFFMAAFTLSYTIFFWYRGIGNLTDFTKMVNKKMAEKEERRKQGEAKN